MSKAFVQIKGLDDLKREEESRQSEKSEEQYKASPSIVSHIHHAWTINRDAKWSVTQRLLNCLRARKGEYSADELQLIANSGGADAPYIKLTSTKSRAAESWLLDILLPAGEDYPFQVGHTPSPELPENLTKLAEEAAIRAAGSMFAQGMEVSPENIRNAMLHAKKQGQSLVNEIAAQAVAELEIKIKDRMAEGGWEKALKEFLNYFTTYPTAFLKGPYDKQERTLKWKNGKPVVEFVTKKAWRAVSPFDMYPSPYVFSIQEGDLIEHIRFTRKSLYDCMGMDGYSNEEILATLDEYDGKLLDGWLWEDYERRRLESGSATMWVTSDNTIDALHYWGDVQGKYIKEWGAEGLNDNAYYPVDAILIGNHVIRCVVNTDPLGERPYHCACWDAIPGSIWGNALPEQMEEQQKMVNAITRALATNLSIAAGPQVMINISRLAGGEDITGINPMKIWQYRDDPLGNTSGTVRPIDFFQPSINADQLVPVRNMFIAEADDVTNVPKYASGFSSDPAAKNATAMSMLMTNAAKGIRRALSNIDLYIIQPTVRQMANHELITNPTPAISGDIYVMAKGSVAILVKEQAQMRLQAFLRDTGQLLGPNAIDKLISENARMQGLDIDKELEADKQMRVQQQQALAASQQAAATEAAMAQQEQSASRVF